MNLEEEGLNILKLYSDKNDKKGKMIYITNDKEKLKNPMDELKIKKDEILKLVPPKNRARSVLYVTGMSGSGKTYFSNQYINEYKKVYPKRKVYLFSSLANDKTLDANKHITRIPLSDKFLNTSFGLDDFKNSLLMFDDIDCIKNKQMKAKLFGILDSLLQTGRHSNSDIIYTSHLACSGKDTRIILAEATSVTLFPKTLGSRNKRYLLGEYFGLGKKDIQKLNKLNTRPVTIIRSYPPVVLSDEGAYIFNSADE